MPRKHRKPEKLYRVNGRDLKTAKLMNGPEWRLGGSRLIKVWKRLSGFELEVRETQRGTYSEHHEQ